MMGRKNFDIREELGLGMSEPKLSTPRGPDKTVPAQPFPPLTKGEEGVSVDTPGGHEARGVQHGESNR